MRRVLARLQRFSQTLQDLMQMRAPFYEKYAHIIVDEEDLDIRGIVKKITTALKNNE